IESSIEITGGVLVELRDLVQELDLASRIARSSNLHFVNADELLKIPALSVERFEDLGDRGLVRCRTTHPLESSERIGVLRIAVEHEAVAFDGFGDLVHLALAQRGKAKHELELRLIGGREPELRFEVLCEIDPHLLARVERV